MRERSCSCGPTVSLTVSLAVSCTFTGSAVGSPSGIDPGGTGWSASTRCVGGGAMETGGGNAGAATGALTGTDGTGAGTTCTAFGVDAGVADGDGSAAS